MKKMIQIILIIFLFSCSSLIILSPVCHASVWIAPMKILAKGNVTENASIYVEKSIYLKNDDNQSATVILEVENNTVKFENDTIELKPFEERYVKTNILVRNGRYMDSIIVKSSPTLKANQSSGSQVMTSMVISVTSIGSSSNTSILNNKDIDNNISSDSNFSLIIIPISFMIILVILVIYWRKQKSWKSI